MAVTQTKILHKPPVANNASGRATKYDVKRSLEFCQRKEARPRQRGWKKRQAQAAAERKNNGPGPEREGGGHQGPSAGVAMSTCARAIATSHQLSVRLKVYLYSCTTETFFCWTIPELDVSLLALLPLFRVSHR